MSLVNNNPLVFQCQVVNSGNLHKSCLINFFFFRLVKMALLGIVTTKVSKFFNYFKMPMNFLRQLHDAEFIFL